MFSSNLFQCFHNLQRIGCSLIYFSCSAKYKLFFPGIALKTLWRGPSLAVVEGLKSSSDYSDSALSADFKGGKRGIKGTGLFWKVSSATAVFSLKWVADSSGCPISIRSFFPSHFLP